MPGIRIRTEPAGENRRGKIRHFIGCEGGISIALKTEITDIPRGDHLAREVVSRIRKAKKFSGFEVTYRIKIFITTDEPLAAVLRTHIGSIRRKTQADRIWSPKLRPLQNGGKNRNINGIKADKAVIGS